MYELKKVAEKIEITDRMHTGHWYILIQRNYTYFYFLSHIRHRCASGDPRILQSLINQLMLQSNENCDEVRT
jgi:hypothetical protein